MWAVGTSFETANTGYPPELVAGQKINVPYPNMIFISMVNTGKDGRFEFEYSYEDKLPSESEAQAGVLYSIETTTGKLESIALS